MLTLKTYAHSMQDEETDLSFADFGTPSAPKRPYTAPLLSDDPTNENAPDLTDRGRLHFLEHETGLEPATPTLAISFSAIPSSSVDVHSRPDSRT